jgi:hypothetical protein
VTATQIWVRCRCAKLTVHPSPPMSGIESRPNRDSGTLERGNGWLSPPTRIGLPPEISVVTDHPAGEDLEEVEAMPRDDGAAVDR